MLVFKYLSREVYTTLFATVLILLAIMMSNQVIKILNDAAIGRFTTMAVIQLISIQIPVLLGYMLPVGLFLSILLAYGRLYAESEMTIFTACGVSPGRILRVTLLYSSVIFVLVAVLIVWAQPKLSLYREQVIAQAAIASPLEKIAKGRFEALGNKRVLYVQGVSDDRSKVMEVFAAELPTEKNPWNIVIADSAEQYYDEEAGSNYVAFKDGYRYIGNPGAGDYQILKFAEYGIRLDPGELNVKTKEQTTSSWELWKIQDKNPVAAAELQWRLAMPICVLVLAFMAVPLSYVHPRQGRFVKILPAIVLYLIYINLMYLSQDWMRAGHLPKEIGLWWVHGVMLLLGWLLWRSRR